MLDLSTFLLRWFFLCGLMRDGPEIQSIPYYNGNDHYSPYATGQQQIIGQAPQIQQQQQQQQQAQIQAPPHTTHPHHNAHPPLNAEEAWRNQCFHGICAYPPGNQRQLFVDALRVQLVQQLGLYFHHQDNEHDDNEHEVPVDSTTAKIEESSKQKRKRNIREYLPQLVSALLQSPSPHDADLVDPRQHLRHLILQRCQEDPTWGIELCWLLEAEVGRGWKNMFEHLQQPGRRLIIVYPKDKAEALKQIGAEKGEAFQLLQDVETVTAYGYYHAHSNHSINKPYPSSISLLRCSHFGDTMHFIDRLTEISMQLRRVPAIDRHDQLQLALQEMNRRLRRRMVTRGQVSLDVEEDPYSQNAQYNDISMDMLKHSVHLPLLPNEGTWPSGSLSADNIHMESDGPYGTQASSPGGVARVLNIVVPETRLLSSRERCPFLVRLEVAETGLDGNDARLYASGAPHLGLTVTEAMGLDDVVDMDGDDRESDDSYGRSIPPELLLPEEEHCDDSSNMDGNATSTADSLRGGWQPDANDGSADYNYDYNYNTYDAVRQHEYEQLHHHMQQQQQQQQQQNQPVQRNSYAGYSMGYQRVQQGPVVSTGEALLNRVFGKPWADVCDEVRQSSPYGHLKGWQLASFIMKAGEDIRQEALVMQIIYQIREWFETEIPKENRPYLRPYTIMCVGGDAGLVECLTDAKSIDEVKKVTDGFVSLRDYFERAYGPPTRRSKASMAAQAGAPPQSVPLQPHQSTALDSSHHHMSFEKAQDNFLRSLVGYSLVCYILQIKDRHNANLLLDREGHVMHIDFGFVLGDMPKMGRVPIFNERAPFKLSPEFWDVLGGWTGQDALGVRFCSMFEKAFACVSAHREELACLVEGIMLTLKDSPLEARRCANSVRENLRMRGAPNSDEQKVFIRDIITTAQTSWGTSSYDWLQKYMNGYL